MDAVSELMGEVSNVGKTVVANPSRRPRRRRA